MFVRLRTRRSSTPVVFCQSSAGTTMFFSKLLVRKSFRYEKDSPRFKDLISARAASRVIVVVG